MTRALREVPAGLVHNGALPEQEPDPGDPEDTVGAWEPLEIVTGGAGR